jgi:hypothetical protein
MLNYFRRGLMTYRLLQVLSVGMQTPVFSIETREEGLHCYGECIFLLQRQFRLFFPGSSQSDNCDNLE